MAMMIYVVVFLAMAHCRQHRKLQYEPERILFGKFRENLGGMIVSIIVIITFNIHQ
jgi:hypothetical protein